MDARSAPTPLAQLSAALLCMALAQATDHAAPGQGNVHLLLPASGMALALLALGGRGLAPALFWGLLLNGAWQTLPPWNALAQALGPVVAATAAHGLVLRYGDFNRDHPSVRTVGHALLWAYGLGAGCAALAATALLALVGALPAAQWLEHFLHQWMGHTLGMLLVTPLVLSWRRSLRHPQPLYRVREGILVWAFAAIAAVAIFGNTTHPRLAPLANAYWLFLPIAWSGVRLGLLSTTGLTGLIGLMALWGSYQHTGFFAQDIANSLGFGYTSYMVILSTIGLALAAWLTEHQRQRTALRIAAIAFDCQEGLLITDAGSRILQANPAFLRLTGFSLPAVLGRTPHFLLATPPEIAPYGRLFFTPPVSHVQRARLLCASGASFPAWVSITPVHDTHANAPTTSHYVISLQDITSLEEHEQRLQARALEQRNTLVREVHHRIKNNLQGIVGMLRALDHEHPQLHSAINQVIDRLHSIAAIHGLQGQSAAENVHLAPLLQAVSQGIAQNWNTPVHLSLEPGMRAWRLASQEAVPVALVLGELIVNAIKHGGQTHQDVQVHLRQRPGQQAVQITISNPGQWPPSTPMPTSPAAPANQGRGMGLVAALLPRTGAQLARLQANERAVVTLDLAPPVIHPEEPEHEPLAQHTPAPPSAGGR